MTDNKDFEKIETIAKKSLEDILNNVDNFIYEDIHKTNLKYLLENDKTQFKNYFRAIFTRGIVLSIYQNDELKYPIKGMDKCYNCGDLVNLCFDGKRIYNEKDNDFCFLEKVFSFDIKVPSGKFIFSDWIPHGLEILGIKDEDVNSLKGRYVQSKNYAETNVMHFFVGNTSPMISQKNNEIIIEVPGYYDDEEEEHEIFYDETFESKGNICTDLWWVTGIDLEYYKDLLKKKFGDTWYDESVKEFLEKDAIILDVEPGLYNCTTFYETCDREDYSKSNLFIKITPKEY